MTVSLEFVLSRVSQARVWGTVGQLPCRDLDDIDLRNSCLMLTTCAVWNHLCALTLCHPSPFLTGYCMESQIGYIQIQISVSHFQNPKIGFQNPRLPFSTKKNALSMPGFYRRASRIQKFASRIRDCHFSKTKNCLEHAQILSEGFQNPRLPVFQKEKQP